MENLKFLDSHIEHKTSRMLLYFFLALWFLIRMYYANKLNLATDEAYYWTWSQNLSLGYYDSGAILGWVIRFWTDIFGNNELAVRTASLILMTGTSVILYQLAKKFISPVLAVFAVILFNITPGGTIVGILMMHDSFMIFFWCLTTYFLYKAIFENKSKFWYFAGISGGLGLWSKDIMVLGFVATFLFLIFSKEYRFWLTKKEPYLAFLISILVFSPIIYWNATNDWVTYRHIFALGTRPMGMDRLKRMGDFLGSQLGLVSPFIFIGIFVSWINIFIKWLKHKDAKKLFLLMFSSFVFVFFFLLSAKSKVEGNWAGFGYILGIICYFYVLEEIWRNSANAKLKYLKYTIFSGIFSLMLIVIMLNPIILYKIVYNLPVVSADVVKAVKTNRTNDLQGWREFGEKIYDFRNNYLQDKTYDEFFFFALRYQVSAQLWFNYPTYPKVRTYCLPISRRMNQFDIWWGLEDLKGKDGIFIAERLESDDSLSRFRAYFDSVELVHSFSVSREDIENEPVRTYYLYLCKNFTGIDKSRQFYMF